MNERSKVLIVDDLEQNLIALEGILSSLPVEIHRALSAREALDLLLVHNFALAIIDVQMPLMDGFDLAETMRGPIRTRDIPIIFVTALDRNNHRWQFRGYETGAVDFMFKPLVPEIVRSKVAIFQQLYQKNLELERHVNLLKGEQELRERFVMTLSHDMRTPLTICKLISTIIKDVSTDKEIGEQADKIGLHIDRVDRMITDLLDASRLEAGQIPKMEMEELELRGLLAGILDDLKATYGDHFVLECPSTVRGWWNEDQLRRVVENLLINAVKYGEPTKSITLSAGVENKNVVLRVHNWGEPLAKEELPRLFDKFHRTHKAHESGKAGWGIGLTVVRGIVEAHGGSISVQSSLENGTTFSVSMPL